MISRARVLGAAFNLLYGRLARVHEFVGWCAFGAAWDARRMSVLDRGACVDGLIVDIGCGDGRLLRQLTLASRTCVGIEASVVMAKRASARGCVVVRGVAEALPLADGCADMIVCTYPGPWITDARSHAEFARVLRAEGRLTMLLGGNYVRGRGTRIRSGAGRIVYGPRNDTAPAISIGGFEGSCAVLPDEWGEAIVWSGRVSTR